MTNLDQLRERSALLDEILKQASQSVVFLDADIRVVQVNPAFTRLFGYTTDELRGRLLSEFIVPDELRDASSDFKRSVLLGHRVEFEVDRQHKDGSRVHVLAVAFPITCVKGLAVCITYRDITERKNSEIALRALSAKLMDAQEAERRHLARELHDQIGQLLTGLRLLLGRNGFPEADGPMKDRREEASQIVDDLFARVRDLSSDLRPPELDQLGLLAALLMHIERYRIRTGILVCLEHCEIERRFGAEVETAAFRIVQEALTNCARHAGVKQVKVFVWAGATTLNLRIRDEGRGFERVVIAAARSSGLVGMRERAALVGGRIVVESKLGVGTTINAELPLPNGPPRHLVD